MSKELLSVLERIAVALEKLAEAGAKAPVPAAPKRVPAAKPTAASRQPAGAQRDDAALAEFDVKILGEGKPWRNGGGESYFAMLADGTKVSVGVKGEGRIGLFAKGEEHRISARRQDGEFNGRMATTLWLESVLDADPNAGNDAGTPPKQQEEDFGYVPF